MIRKPFGTVATAIAFSPNMEANICESVRIKNMVGEKLLLIHVGPRDEESEAKLRSIVENCGAGPGDIEIIWESGDPAAAILKVAGERQVDLMIAGAQPREGLLRYYMGSVARRLVRKANCSILLMTHPNSLKHVCGRIVVNGLDHPKTPQTLQTAISVAHHFGAGELIIVEEVEPSRIGTKVEDDQSLQQAEEAKRELEAQEAQRINSILQDLETPALPVISQRCIFGKKGYTIGHFAETMGADLLVMNSPDTQLGFLDRVFTHDLEYILSELPSDLLIVHSQKKDS